MTSKNISITEEVYNKLNRLKKDDETYSHLFLRLIKNQKSNIKDYFGAWNLSEDELSDIWQGIDKRSERRWK